MLDDKCECVLKKILAFSRGEYTVLDSSDFSEMENADEVISKLEECGYIALGYSDDSEYLLKPTAAGKNYFASKNDMLLTQGVFLRKTAVYALIGGLLGGFIACAIGISAAVILSFAGCVNA